LNSGSALTDANQLNAADVRWKLTAAGFADLRHDVQAAPSSRRSRAFNINILVVTPGDGLCPTTLGTWPEIKICWPVHSQGL
jgi:hypothetical protein